MKRRFLVMALLVAVPLCANADVIRVIQDDGTVKEVEIKAPAPPPEPVRQPAPKPRVAPQAPAATEPAAEEIAVPEVNRTPVEQLRPELAAEPEAIAKPDIEEDDQAQSEDVSAELAPAPKYDGPPIPQRKPAAAKYASPGVYAPSRADVTPGKSIITKDVALAIALENGAPPARSVQVLPRNIEGREIFVVQFRTEDGLFDMLVDRTTGDIIKREF